MLSGFKFLHEETKNEISILSKGNKIQAFEQTERITCHKPTHRNLGNFLLMKGKKDFNKVPRSILNSFIDRKTSETGNIIIISIFCSGEKQYLILFLKFFPSSFNSIRNNNEIGV